MKIQSHKKYTKKYNKNKYNRSIKKRIRNKRGGKLFGKGSYGTVLGSPRIPCVGETYEQIKDKKEVSKVFSEQKYANQEGQVREKIKSILGDDTFNELIKYAVFPITQCKINNSEIESHPDIYNEEWGTRFIPNMDVKQITSEQGSGDLSKYFQLVQPLKPADDTHSLPDILQKLQSILDGIDILQKNKLVHFDLKTGNCISLKNDEKDVFKIIDVGDIDLISNIHFLSTQTLYLGYPYRPSINIFYDFFDSYSDDYATEIKDIKLTQYMLNNLVSGPQSDYSSSAIRFFDKILKNSLLQTKFELEEDEKNFINTLYVLLVSQKVFHYGLTNMSEPIKSEIMNEPNPAYSGIIHLSRPPEHLPLYNLNIQSGINYYNNIIDKHFIQKGKTLEELKEDLLLRTDIYSFGILLLELLNNYNKNYEVGEIITSEEKILYLRICLLAYECCYQFESVKDTTKISDILQNILNNKPSTQDIRFFDGEKYKNIDLPDSLKTLISGKLSVSTTVDIEEHTSSAPVMPEEKIEILSEPMPMRDTHKPITKEMIQEAITEFIEDNGDFDYSKDSENWDDINMIYFYDYAVTEEQLQDIYNK
jgi:serine/threonine protein kinase